MPPMLQFEGFINKTSTYKQLTFEVLCPITFFFFFSFFPRAVEACGRDSHADIGVCLSWHLQSAELSNITHSIMIILLKVSEYC